MLSQDFREFVGLLKEHQVEYLIVGGYAVGYYGHPRYTGDLDIWINRTPENAENLLSCLEDFGFGSLDLTEKDFLTEDAVIQLGNPPLRIDILTDVDGVTFDECYPKKKQVEVEGLTIDFIGYEDLIKNKQTTNRPIDQDDIEKMKGK